MLSILVSGAVGGLIRALLEPDTTLGIGCKAGAWKGMLFNAISGLAFAWIFTSLLGKEQSIILAFLIGYVLTDVLDSLLYISLKPFSKKHSARNSTRSRGRR